MLNRILKKEKLDIENLCTACDVKIFNHLVKEFQSFERLAVALGLSETEREGIKNENQNDSMRKIRVLEVWKRTKGFDATYLILVEAFLTITDRQAAEYIVAFVKQQTHASPPDQGTEKKALCGGYSQEHERKQEQKGNAEPEG